MSIKKPFFTCARCRVTTLALATPEKFAGDWMIRCPECSAKNLIVTIRVSKIEVPTAEIAGWCD